MNRTDCHRPGAIVPADYEYQFSYIIPGADPFERFNTDVAVDACNEARAAGHEVWGGMGKCGVCGACYRYCDVWEHVPTGDLLHLGHDCAAKYELLANRPEFDAALASLESRRKAMKEATRRSRVFEAFCDANPGLRESFELGDGEGILGDLAAKLRQYGSLSPKQVAFALSLGSERMCPEKPKNEEVKVAAPVSDKRQVVRGILVSKKAFDGAYGTSIKGTIKVTTPEGVWLAWGTLPSSLLLDYSPAGETVRAEVGDEVELTAKLTAGREPHFALFKRPTNGKIITKAAAKEAA